MLRTGGCRCGAIRFSVSGEPLGGVACHCRDCQYASGGSANLTWIFERAGFAIERGTPCCFKAKPTSGGTFFCGDCGVQIFSQPDSNLQLIAVKVGALDDAAGFSVQADIWMKSAPPWHSRHEGAVQFNENLSSALK